MDKYKQIAENAWERFSSIDIAKLSRIAEGYKNKSFLIKDFRGEAYVLKVYALDFLSDKTITKYSNILAELFKEGVPTIEPVIGLDGHYLQIIEHEGVRYQTTMSRFIEVSLPSEIDLNKDILEVIASCSANLHEKLEDIEISDGFRVFNPIETLKKMLQDDVVDQIKHHFQGKYVYNQNHLDTYIKNYIKDGERLLNYFETRKEIFKNSQPIHGDFQITNLNIRNGQVKTIFDFDEMTLAPVTFEIGCSLVHLDEGAFLTEDLVECYLSKYTETKTLGKKEIEDVLMFMQYRAFYRISRWFTYYRLLEKDSVHFTVEHFSKYQYKLNKYKSLDKRQIVNYLTTY
jgi:Ser/Thr protein kinase RdoA (MazF antagonist)